MITRIVKLTINPSHFLEFIKIYSEAQNTIRFFDGCKSLEVYTDVQMPLVVFTISKWNTEHDLNRYRFSEFFKNVWTQVKPMFSSKAEAWSLVSIGDNH